jgi:hypothetical protein
VRVWHTKAMGAYTCVVLASMVRHADMHNMVERSSSGARTVQSSALRAIDGSVVMSASAQRVDQAARPRCNPKISRRQHLAFSFCAIICRCCIAIDDWEALRRRSHGFASARLRPAINHSDGSICPISRSSLENRGFRNNMAEVYANLSKTP